jgi:uncharacterized protein
MQLEYDFTVPVPPSRAWNVLLDLERVVPCPPGATLTSYDGEGFVGSVRVKLGPVNLSYQGKGRFVSRDEQAGRVVIEASGRETKSGGTAATSATMTLRPAADAAATVVTVLAELSVTGRPVQFGRGMIADVGGKLIGQFADCLAQRLAASLEPVGVSGDAELGDFGTLAGEPDGGLLAGEPDAGRLAWAPDARPLAEKPDGGPVADVAPVAPARVADPEPAVQPAVSAAPPVDLLRISAGPVLRRIAPYAIGFLVGALVVRVIGRARRPE